VRLLSENPRVCLDFTIMSLYDKANIDYRAITGHRHCHSSDDLVKRRQSETREIQISDAVAYRRVVAAWMAVLKSKNRWLIWTSSSTSSTYSLHFSDLSTSCPIQHLPIGSSSHFQYYLPSAFLFVSYFRPTSSFFIQPSSVHCFLCTSLTEYCLLLSLFNLNSRTLFPYCF
jgi:hypothetical protein